MISENLKNNYISQQKKEWNFQIHLYRIISKIEYRYFWVVKKILKVYIES